MWEIASGFIRTDDDGFLILKQSVDITSIADDGTSGGAYDVSLYDTIDISDVVGGNDGWTYFGNGANAVFGNDNVRTALGIPLSTGVSSSGTTQFGNDGLYRYLRDQMACLFGGYWGHSALAGVFALYLGDARSNSNYNVGCRAYVIV